MHRLDMNKYEMLDLSKLSWLDNTYCLLMLIVIWIQVNYQYINIINPLN